MKKYSLILILFVVAACDKISESEKAEIKKTLLGGTSKFTPALNKDVYYQFAEFDKKDCPPNNDGPCGYTFDIETCSPDSLKAAASYLEIKKAQKYDDGYNVEVSWGHKATSYRLNRENNNLMIDGIVCRFDDGGELKFNWK